MALSSSLSSACSLELDRADWITEFVQGFIPSATLEEERGRELRYLLPLPQVQSVVEPWRVLGFPTGSGCSVQM